MYYAFGLLFIIVSLVNILGHQFVYALLLLIIALQNVIMGYLHELEQLIKKS